MTSFPIVTVAIVDGNAEDPQDVQLVALNSSKVKLLHPLNALLSIVATEVGIVIEVGLLQPLNAPAPIVVTEVGMVIYVRLLQSKNA